MKDNMMITLSGTPWGTLEMFVKVDDVINIINEIEKGRNFKSKGKVEKLAEVGTDKGTLKSYIKYDGDIYTTEKNINNFKDLEKYYQNASFDTSTSTEQAFKKKIYSNAIWISARLDKENMWTGFRFEEWGEIVLEYRNFNNVYCEVVVGKDKFYLMRRPHMKGITNPACFDYTEDCMEVLNEELDKCKKLC